MAIWDGIPEQERVKRVLRRAIEQDRVPHAYLFSGPSGSPLEDTALALAASLNCLEAPGDGCGRCEACAKTIGSIHPDIVTVQPEGTSAQITIKAIVPQVIGRLGLPPHEAKVRVFIVPEATNLDATASNALLKTLEEPPRRTLFVLCTTAPDQLLTTLRSRCQRIRFEGAAAAGAEADPERAARIARLGEELAADRHDPTLPARIAEGKGDVGPVVVAAARALHARAREAARHQETHAARRAARRAAMVLSWHKAVTDHHATVQLAIDALISQLAEEQPA